MWKLVFFVVTWLAQVVISSQTANDSFDSDLEAEFDRIAEDLLSAFTLAHSPPLQRQKRDLYSDQKLSFIDETGVYRLQTITPVSRLCYPAIDTKFINVGTETYAICVSAQTQDSPAEVVVGVYREHVWSRMTSWFVGRPNSLSAFYFNGYIYVLVADSEKVKGTDLVRINIASAETSVDHTVHSKPATSLTVWEMKMDNSIHMAIANSAGHSTYLTSEVFVYEWFGTYFDRYTSIKAYDVRDIEAFNIHDTPYLAIANYRKSLNNYEVDSEILRYNLNKKGWISHQKITTHGATDIEFFTLGSGISKEFFLAVANKEDNGPHNAKSMIYKFAKDLFVPFQCLPTSRVSSIASWSTKYAFLLAIASSDDAVHIFQYDGWRFVQSAVQFTQGSMSYGVNAMIFYNITKGSEEVPILSVSNPEHPMELSVFEIGLRHENSLNTWAMKSTEWCYNTLQRVESTDTDSLIRALDDVLYTDQVTPIVIEGNVNFKNGFEVGKLQTPRLKEIISQEIYDTGMLLKLENIHKRLQELDLKLQEFEEIVKKSLKIEGNQTVSGHFKFQDVIFDCEKHNCQFDSINTTFLNGEDVSNWPKNLVFLDSERIDGTLYADFINASSINVVGLIDGVDSETLVTKSGTHFITGNKTFTSPISAHEIEVHGKVDGVEITHTNVLLTTGYQTITGNYVFDEIDTNWLEVTGYLNDINLTRFYEDVVRADQPSVITGKKIFHDLVIDELNMVPGSTINGIDLADLWENTLWKDGHQNITAPMAFHSVRMMKNLAVPMGINNINIPGPRVVDTNDINRSVRVSAHQEFKQPTKIAHLEVLNSLNGLGVQISENNPPQLDIMLKSGNQVVSGQKTFHTIHLDSDSIVNGLVDGVDLSELKAIVLSKDSAVDTNRTWIFNNLVIKGPLTVQKISGYDLESIYENAWKLTDQIPEIVFKEVIHIDDLESEDINGINIKRDLVLVNEPQTLSGKKIFREIILEDNSIVLNTINDVSVTFLNETILRIGNQVLNSRVFKKNVKMNSLTVKGSINNIPIEELVTLNKPETFLHAKELRNVTFLEIEANNLEVSGTVNGVNIKEMVKNTLTYEGKQEVRGKLIVKGNINVGNEKDLKVGLINGVNISELWEDAVLIDEPQIISGEKRFLEPVFFSNLEFKDTIDGVSEKDINNWMLKDKHQTVEGDIIFASDLSIDNLKVNGLINNININELNASIVKTNEPSVIEGPIIFGDVVSKGPVTLTGKIQGIDLSEEAVTRSGDKIITSEKTFTKDLVIEGDLFVEGLVDGVSIADICENTLVVRREQNITHLTIKGDVVLLGGSLVGGKISGVDFEKLHEIAGFDGNSVNIEGHKIFSNITIDGPVTLEGMFGGIDLKQLNQSYMSLTRNQDITGEIEFEEVEFNGALTAGDYYSLDNKVNGIDIKDLNDRILKVEGTQTITAEHHFDEVVFADDVFVAGKVNGLDVPGGLMRRNKPNYIQSPKIFEKPVEIVEDLIIAEGKQIQGVDVSEWFKTAVLNNGETFEIHGEKIFKNLTVTDAWVEGLLDGVKVSEDHLLMTYGDQVITGKKTIKGDVEITGSLTLNGLVNNVDLNYLSSNTLQRDRTNTVTGEKYFTKPVTINYLEAPSVAGVDIQELQRKVNTHLDFDLVQNRLSEIEGVIASVQEAISKQAVIFQYYELFQEFNIPKAYNWFYLANPDCGEMLILLENSSSVGSCSTMRIFNYESEKQLFFASPRELVTSSATSVRSLFINGRTFLFVANQNPKSCLGEGAESKATSDIYIWKNDDFVLFQTISMASVVHMEVFADNETACAIYADIRSTGVYCSSGIEDNFALKETLPTIGCRKAAIIDFGGTIILAVATEDLRERSTYSIGEGPIDIFFWNSIDKTFSNPVQVISSTNVQSLLLMSHFTGYSTDLFLVISMGKIPKILNEPKIVIFRFDEATSQFNKYQVLKENGELEWIVLPSGELILFILNLPEGNIKLYEHKDASGFVHVDTVNSIGTVNMHAFTRSHDPEDRINHYLALAGPYALMARTSQGTDYAKILKSKVKGQRYFINP